MTAINCEPHVCETHSQLIMKSTESVGAHRRPALGSRACNLSLSDWVSARNRKNVPVIDSTSFLIPRLQKFQGACTPKMNYSWKIPKIWFAWTSVDQYTPSCDLYFRICVFVRSFSLPLQGTSQSYTNFVLSALFVSLCLFLLYWLHMRAAVKLFQTFLCFSESF